MDPRYWNGPIDCPACGASREAALAIATITADGVSVTARCCGMVIWQGTVVARGRAITAAAVIRRVHAVRPDLYPMEAYREPWERRIVLGLEPSPLSDNGDVGRRGESADGGAAHRDGCSHGRIGGPR